jgi:hypothetical protein
MGEGAPRGDKTGGATGVTFGGERAPEETELSREGELNEGLRVRDSVTWERD